MAVPINIATYVYYYHLPVHSKGASGDRFPAACLGALNLLFRKVRVYCLLVNSNNSTHSVAHCNLRLFHHFFLSQFNNTMHDVPTSRRFFLAHCITFCSVIYVSVRMGLRKSINCYNPVCVGHLTTSSIHDTLP